MDTLKPTLVLLLLLCFAPLAAADEPILLVTNEWTPYVSSDRDNPGLITEIILAAFKEAGVEVQVEFRPWRRCALMVEDGAAFAAFPYARTETRQKYAWFSDPIWECRNVFFYLKGRRGNFDYTSLEALRSFVIAGTSGNYYEGVFREKNLTVDYAPGEASGVRKLWEYRADLFAEAEAVGWTLINRLFPGSTFMFGSTPTPWNVNPQSLMVSRRYPDAHILMERFNSGLKTIRENGTYTRIVRKYVKEMSVVEP